MSIRAIEMILKDFRDTRNWQKFHSEPELARSLMIEAAELNRLYQWGKEPDKTRLKEELADVFIYGLYLCMEYGFDLEQIIIEKVNKNGAKYPLNVDHAQINGWKGKQS